jgi:pimeloyl-ACP methyl ester carboxylesterase
MEKLRIPPGLTMAYEAHGEGPTLVQVHGLGAGSREGEGVWNFKYTTPLLSETFKVVNIDMPGYGQSDPPPDGGGLLELSDHVASFIREYEGGPVFVHGSSFGGSTVIALAGRHPELIKRMVVSVCLLRDDAAARARRKLWMAVMELNRPDLHVQISAQSGFAREFYERPDASQILAEYLAVIEPDYPKKDALRSLMDVDLTQFADVITVPTLCIGGAEDQMTPFDPASSGAGIKEFSERIAKGELTVIEGAGHYIHCEKPRETSEVITEFLTRRAANPEG